MALDWDKLRIFYAVAEAGSFTKAGEKLNLSQSAISRQISGLENSIQVPLFHRHARGLLLTEQGEMLFRTARKISSQLSIIEGRLKDSRETPSGPLRITTSVALGSIWLTKHIKDFIEHYPSIEISMLLDDSGKNLAMREADIALRMSSPTEPDLIQRHVMSIKMRCFASPEYLKEFGMPQSMEDLDNHRIIAFGDSATPPFPNVDWLLSAGTDTPRKPWLCVNNTYAILRTIEHGIGIGSLPDFISKEATNLIQILQDAEAPTIEVYFVYPEELRNSPRVSVFRNFLLKSVKQMDHSYI